MRMTIMASLPPTHIVWGGGIPPSAPGNGEGMGGDWKRDTFQTPLISRSIPRSKVNRIFLGDKIYASLGKNKERRVQLTKLYE